MPPAVPAVTLPFSESRVIQTKLNVGKHYATRQDQLRGTPDSKTEAGPESEMPTKRQLDGKRYAVLRELFLKEA